MWSLGPLKYDSFRTPVATLIATVVGCFGLSLTVFSLTVFCRAQTITNDLVMEISQAVESSKEDDLTKRRGNFRSRKGLAERCEECRLSVSFVMGPALKICLTKGVLRIMTVMEPAIGLLRFRLKGDLTSNSVAEDGTR